MTTFQCGKGHKFLHPMAVTEHTTKNVHLELIPANFDRDTLPVDASVADWLEKSWRVCPIDDCGDINISEVSEEKQPEQTGLTNIAELEFFEASVVPGKVKTEGWIPLHKDQITTKGAWLIKLKTVTPQLTSTDGSELHITTSNIPPELAQQAEEAYQKLGPSLKKLDELTTEECYDLKFNHPKEYNDLLAQADAELKQKVAKSAETANKTFQKAQP
jgi:hypothetical protein